MESETSDFKIFFKIVPNKLKGPYPERRVQEWYGEDFFEGSTPFYFMKGDERPTEQTEFITLDTLRTLNGVECPFASSTEKSEELEKVVEDVEKRLKELSTQPPPTSSSSAVAATPVATAAAAPPIAAKKPEKKPEENSEHAKLANAWAAYYIDVLEAYATDNWDKVEGNMQLLDSMAPAISSEPLQQKCREVLLKKLIELEYVYCSDCDVIFHNFKQIMLHVVSRQHNCDRLGEPGKWHTLQMKVNKVMQEMFHPLLKRLLTAEENHIQELLVKDFNIDSSEDMRPLPGFVDSITETYGDDVFDCTVHEPQRAKIIAKMIPRFKQNVHLGRKLMAELHEHIGDAQTRCDDCDMATGTRAEYYQHLRTVGHILRSDVFDLITLVVNMYQKN